MSAHKIAWDSIKDELYKGVLEISTKIPWGFFHDKPDIKNVHMDAYLASPTFSETIIFHILAGEGAEIPKIEKLINLAYDNCVKLIIMEHNPDSLDWVNDVNVTKERFGAVRDIIYSLDEDIIEKNLERNYVFLLSTLKPLSIPQISDKYMKENINKKYIRESDHGICKRNLIYNKTSEAKIIESEVEKLAPYLDKEFYWVIGGQFYLECLDLINSKSNHLIDSVLLQVFLARYVIETQPDGTFIKKMDSLYSTDEFQRIKNDSEEFERQGNNPEHWRNVIHNRNYEGLKERIASIKHVSLQDLKVSDSVVYISTVAENFWSHLKKDNIIINALYPVRDVPTINLKK